MFRADDLRLARMQAVRSFQMENFRGGHGGEQKISSFKEIDVFIGEMDFQADENLLEHLLNFVVDLPFEDLSQVGSANSVPQRFFCPLAYSFRSLTLFGVAGRTACCCFGPGLREGSSNHLAGCGE